MIAVSLLLSALTFEDPTANRLTAAKGTYDREMDAVKTLTIEWFDKELVARRGDRSGLSELEGSRKLFDKNLEPPPRIGSGAQEAIRVGGKLA